MIPTLYTDDGVHLVASFPGVEVHIAHEEYVRSSVTRLDDLFPAVTINGRPATWRDLTPDDLHALGCRRCEGCGGDGYHERMLPARTVVQLSPDHERVECDECDGQGWTVEPCGLSGCDLPMIAGDGTGCGVCCERDGAAVVAVGAA